MSPSPVPLPAHTAAAVLTGLVSLRCVEPLSARRNVAVAKNPKKKNGGARRLFFVIADPGVSLAPDSVAPIPRGARVSLTPSYLHV